MALKLVYTDMASRSIILNIATLYYVLYKCIHVHACMVIHSYTVDCMHIIFALLHTIIEEIIYVKLKVTMY